MNYTHKILASEISSQHTMVSREMASIFVNKIKNLPWHRVEIDFSNVSFISRSFADQFHKEKMTLWETGEKEIVVINAQADVLEMFKAVSKTQNAVNRNFEGYQLIEFTSRRSLKEFLQAI